MTLVKPVKKRTVATKATVTKEPAAKKRILKGVVAPKKVELPPFDINAWVFLEKPNVKYGDSTYQQNARKFRVPCKVTRIQRTAPGMRDSVTDILPDDVVYINITKTHLTQASQQALNYKDVLQISEEVAVERLKLVEIETKAVREQAEREINEKLCPPHIPVLKRKPYTLLDKTLLNTNSNYVQLVNGIGTEKVNPKYNIYSNNCGAVCCALTKTTSSVMTYIPKLWMNYFGYSLEDLKAWLSFLSNCEIGFTYSLYEDEEGKAPLTLGKVFGNSVTTTDLSLPNNNFYINPEMECYKVLVRGSSSMITYMHFILLRYMYNQAYWNIPAIAMKIKLSVGDALSFWDCLLLAHNNELYNGYYALFARSTTTVILPNSQNTQKTVLQRLRNNTGMNSSFQHSSVSSVGEVSNLIKTEKYDKLIEYVEKNRK